jgi:hypothetical protein
VTLEAYPATNSIVRQLIAFWPEHENFLNLSFRDRPERLLRTGEDAAAIILDIAAATGLELAAMFEDYKFLCERFIEEEYFFRREERYRLQTFADADAEVYSNAPFMRRYLNWILLSHVLVVNHAAAIDTFRHDYMARCRTGGRHLEVGPGHGLLLFFAIQSKKFSAVNGWDVSETSIALCTRNLAALGADGKARLTLHDVVATPPPTSESEKFSSIAISEVLEHLEDPHLLLRRLADHLEAEGLIWINVPINSPAPDHIYLFRTIDEARALVTGAGLTVVDEKHCPMAGMTLERALKHELTVNCTFTAHR